MKFGESAPKQEKSSEESQEKRGYSLEKWRNAPEETLSPEEHQFMEEFTDRIESIASRVEENPSLARIVLREMVRPDVWHVLLKTNKAEKILDKARESKEGQMGLAQEEAEAMNEKYDQLREEMEDAIVNFANFIDEANGREEGSDTVALAPKKNEDGQTLH